MEKLKSNTPESRRQHRDREHLRILLAAGVDAAAIRRILRRS